MEVLGNLMYKSLMERLPKTEIGDEKFQQLEKAYFELFQSIVYWLQFSFNSEVESIT